MDKPKFLVLDDCLVDYNNDYKRKSKTPFSKGKLLFQGAPPPFKGGLLPLLSLAAPCCARVTSVAAVQALLLHLCSCFPLASAP